MLKKTRIMKNPRRWIVGAGIVSVLGVSAALYALNSNYLFLSLGAGADRLTNSVGVLMDQYGTTNSYYTNQKNNFGFVSGAGAEAIYDLGHNVNVMVGPAVYYADLGKVSGVEYPNSNTGVFDTLNYQFNAYSIAAMLESRLVWNISAWQPMLIAGIGNAWNKLSRYSEVPTDPNGSAASATNVFQNNTLSHFAYEVGLGVQHHLFTSEKYGASYDASLEYRYFNFGDGKLGQSIDQVSDQYLRATNMQTHAVLLTLSTSFG